MNDNVGTENPQQPVDKEVKVRAALAEFCFEAAFNEVHRAESWRKRGLSTYECEQAGYRSSQKSNGELILKLLGKYEVETLLAAGLCVKGPAGEVKPNSQFCGFGLLGRKNGKEVWGGCDPVIIPYLDAQGRMFHLRPHKGGIAGKPPHLYVIRRMGVGDARCATAIVTEGEHKAHLCYRQPVPLRRGRLCQTPRPRRSSG